jgi:uncharacterized protein YecE (DUF72 family)
LRFSAALTETAARANDHAAVPSKIYVGTAGWSIPRQQQRRFPEGDSHLERFARALPAVEINSTFYRPHRAETFERWAGAVPRAFRFSVKLPREITHDARLAAGSKPLTEFLATLEPLGAKLGCLLVQLAPSHAFDARVARRFFKSLRARFDRGLALEPRHASWFEPRVQDFLEEFEIARVAADPPRVGADAEPGGWGGLAYYRLHGSPRIYYSPYEPGRLDTLAARLDTLRRRRTPTWCIFDNTASGAAAGDALSLFGRLTP